MKILFNQDTRQDTRRSILRLAVVAVVAAGMGGRFAAAPLVSQASMAPGPTAIPTISPALTYVLGSTTRVAQLTGDFDRTLKQPTLSQTDKRFGVYATDLGSSFEHKGNLFFLFGDTWGQPGLLDAVAWTNSRDPRKIALDFHPGAGGKWQPPTVPGLRQGAFEVPSGGVSVGGRMVVVFTTDWMPDKYLMGRSVVAVSQDDGQSFKALYDLSTTKFINVSFWSSGKWLYIFGSGAYRRSSVYLARIKRAKLADRSQLRYLSGIGPKQKPRWSAREEEAAPIFQHEAVGEFSVAYCQPVRRFVLLYNSGNPRGIIMRSASTPWGPWSNSEMIFDPWRDKGYGYFMHIPAGFKSERHDTVNDPGRENEWGGEYGPYIMARYTTGYRGRCRIFYTLSTWNPYQVVVMQTDLKLQPVAARPESAAQR